MTPIPCSSTQENLLQSPNTEPEVQLKVKVQLPCSFLIERPWSGLTTSSITYKSTRTQASDKFSGPGKKVRVWWKLRVMMHKWAGMVTVHVVAGRVSRWILPSLPTDVWWLWTCLSLQGSRCGWEGYADTSPPTLLVGLWPSVHLWLS